MKIKTGITALLMAVFMLFPCLCGCGKEPAGQTTVTEDTTAAAEPSDAMDEPLLLLDGSTAVYRLIRPDDTADAVIELYKKIVKAAKSAGISGWEGTTDWVKTGTEVDSKKEVLLGYTSRPESKTVMEKLNYNDFAIEVVNNKVVIAAHNEEKLAEAVNYFTDKLLKFEEKDGKVCAYLTGTYTSRGAGASCFGDGTLSDCTIVYPYSDSTLKTAAKTLQEAIKKAYGIEPGIISDKLDKTEHEIVIGQTTRDISNKFADKISSMDYCVAAADGSLLIMGDGDSATSKAVAAFIDSFVNNYYTWGISIGENFLMNDTLYSFSTDPARADGTDFRVMSFNLLCELWDAKVAIAGRDDSAFAAIKYYAPDVVGLQEVSDGWYTALDKLFGTEYAFTDRKTTQGKTNFSTLAYNTETLTLLDHGVQVFSKGNDSRLRLATWGYFEIKASGKKFIAVSTHWDLSKNTEYQLIHSKEMGELVLELGKKYNCAVVTTGDYNSNEESAPYQNFIADTGYKDAKYSAAVIADKGKTTHTLYSDVTAGTLCIDHIFGSDKLDFLYFNILKDKTVIDTSDHCPIYADVKLK